MLKRYFSKTNLCWIALAAVVFTVVTVLINAGLLGSYYQITLYNICINRILAVSLNLIIGICGQFSLGHAGFMCIGAYSAAIMVKSMPNMGGFAIGIIIGLIISAIAALIVSIPTLRLRGDYLAIATLGFSEIIRIVVLNMEITRSTETEKHNACAIFSLQLNKRCTVAQVLSGVNATEGVISVEEL